MKLQKAKITISDFNRFMDYYNSDKALVESLLIDVNDCLIPKHNKMHDKVFEMFDRHFMGNDGRKNTFSLENPDNKKLSILVEYMNGNGLEWNVVDSCGKYLYLCFSGTYMFWITDFCTITDLPDYDAMSMSEARALIGSDITSNMLPAEMNTLSIKKANDQKSEIESKKNVLKSEKEAIKEAKSGELKALDEQIQKLKNELAEKKNALLSQLHEKESELQSKLEELDKQIYMMESEIYAIRSYSGETIELNKIRGGKPADVNEPLIVNQKLMYLDEDLARIMSIYQDDISCHFSLFQDAVAANDDVFESFCPQERCLTFFRLSNNATYDWYNGERHMYETEQLIHGKKMGFLLKDGERAYIGWMDESWRIDKKGDPVPVTFQENLMYRPNEKREHELSDNDYSQSDSTNTMLSRAFALSVIQGILDNKRLIQFPQKVSITNPGTYIKFNYATGWITDDRFGDFATLVENLNKRTKVKDQILLCYNKTYGLQGRGEKDRTYDCEVPEGINRVNFLEADEYGRCDIYVSARKKFSNRGATANVLCKQQEYINITYMNSVWLRYYVQTKKLGRYVNDYAKMIKHFKRAIEIIEEREAEEMAYIKAFYPEADQIPEWQVLLSHWKLNHNIRFINSFQAKRIAKYLESGKYEENAHLFEKEEIYNIDYTFGGEYMRTQFRYTGLKIGKYEDDFGRESHYYYDSFYLREYDATSKWSEEKEKKRQEENAIIIAKDITKLEARIPDRLIKDKEKLNLVNDRVMTFLNEHGVSVSNLTDESYCLTPLIFDEENNKISFKDVNNLSTKEKDRFLNESENSYPEYILKSECWKLAYYDYVHKSYGHVLHDAKMVLHQWFMTDTKSV